jgi:hypothetical protein
MKPRRIREIISNIPSTLNARAKSLPRERPLVLISCELFDPRLAMFAVVEMLQT